MDGINHKTEFFLRPERPENVDIHLNTGLCDTKWSHVPRDGEEYLSWLECKHIVHDHLLATDEEVMRNKVHALETMRSAKIIIPEDVPDDEYDTGKYLMPMLVRPTDHDDTPQQHNSNPASADQGPPSVRIEEVEEENNMPPSNRPMAAKKRSRDDDDLPPTTTALNAAEMDEDDDDHERRSLLMKIDTLKMKYKDSIIPPNLEDKNLFTVRTVLQRNVQQLRKARAVAQYKMGMAAVLVVVEFVMARFCRLDMSRFMKWHYANNSFLLCALFFACEGVGVYIHMTLLCNTTCICMSDKLRTEEYWEGWVPVKLSLLDTTHRDMYSLLSAPKDQCLQIDDWTRVLTVGYYMWKQGSDPDSRLGPLVIGVQRIRELELQMQRAEGDHAMAVEAMRSECEDTHREWEQRLRCNEEARNRAITRYTELETDVDRRIKIICADRDQQREVDAEHWRWRLDTEATRLQEVVNRLQSDEVNRLQVSLREREQEITLLRHSNATKGTQGEQLVGCMLREAFPDYEIVDTSSRPHAADIEIIDPHRGNARVIIECKSKRCVDRKDLNRFMSDIRTQQTEAGSVIGAVFVSTQSSNIPGKGPVSVEIAADINLCVLFLGYETEDDCRMHMVSQVRLFMCLCHIVRDTQRRIGNCGEDGVQEERLRVCMEDIRYCYESLHRQKSQLRQFVASMSEEHRRMLDRLQVRLSDSSGLVVSGELAPQQVVGKQPPPQAVGKRKRVR